jgi:hypothetical protein
MGAQIFQMVTLKWWVTRRRNQGFCASLWLFCECSNLHTFNIVRMWKVLEMHFVICTKWKQFKISFFGKVFHHKMQEGNDMLMQSTWWRSLQINYNPLKWTLKMKTYTKNNVFFFKVIF